ncbi:MAG: tRNA pseudouridine(55) synthase TruB [Actinobacteria bacterium]|nr:tRNA pseudouridine(55) synthase TruB [Actinomycetota bacterium]
MTLNGIVVVDKPPFITSHDVVDAFRAISTERRVGHCGTLDPQATGVIVLVVGKATRLSQYLPVDPKEYEGEITLGIETETYDTMGEVLFEKECVSSDDEILEAFNKFTGTFFQLPPPYSAKKVRGVPLYKLARKGESVEVQPKEVTVEKLDILNIRRENGKAIVSFVISVSRGTYIRSIAHDVGQILGCGGTLTSLRRVKSGYFTIDMAWTLDRLEKAASEGELEKAIIKPSEALPNLKTVVVKHGYVGKVARGEPIQLRMIKGLKTKYLRGEIVKVVDERNRLLSLARWTGDLAKSPLDIVAKSFLVLV